MSRFTYEQHQRMGEQIKAVRRTLILLLEDTYPAPRGKRSRRASNRIEQALRRLDLARSDLDDELFDSFTEVPYLEKVRVYYGAEEAS